MFIPPIRNQLLPDTVQQTQKTALLFLSLTIIMTQNIIRLTAAATMHRQRVLTGTRTYQQSKGHHPTTNREISDNFCIRNVIVREIIQTDIVLQTKR